jgi:DNA-binding transcriptional ArsR family regulator
LASVELETRRIDVSLVDQGLLSALAADRVSHEQTVERIRRLHKLGLVVTERLARGEQVYPNLPRGAVRRALEALREAAIIESRGRADWRFASPLLRRYLAGIGLFE